MKALYIILKSDVRSEVSPVLCLNILQKFTILSTHVFNFQALTWYLKSALQNKGLIILTCMIQIIRKARKDLTRKYRKKHYMQTDQNEQTD